jgi:integrase/recombinase XerD
MKSPIQLYLRVRLPDGTYPYLKAAYVRNGRIRPLQAIKDGKVVSFPGSRLERDDAIWCDSLSRSG